MTLDWKRAGCASIAECVGFTFNTYRAGDEWYATRTSSEGYGIHGVGAAHQTQQAAEAACESWLEQHDRPEWHDVTDWLSWAEWRGWRMACQMSLGGTWFTKICRETKGANTHATESASEAKAVAEKWVREQGAR